MKFNEQKLTDYVLNELPEDERRAIEEEIENNPEVRKAVEEIRELSSTLSKHYTEEEQILLTDEQREAIYAAARKRRKEKITAFPTKPRIPMAIAASISILFIMFSGSLVIFSVVEKREMAFCPPVPPKSRPQMKLKKLSVKAAPRPASAQRIVSTSRQSRSEMQLPRSSGLGKGIGGFELMEADAEGFVANQWGPSLENYAEIQENEFLRVVNEPLSTFSIDVDTASYANVRRFLKEGRLPPKDAVRIEEMINYFNYNYAPPRGNVPFSAHFAQASCPWNPGHKLVRIALKGREIEQDMRPPLNLVFLLDVSGSMSDPNKLPLVKRAMEMLANQLDERDRVSIVVYAGASGLVLPPTSGADERAITSALKRLEAGGGTNGGQGIELAYRTALENYRANGVNRVILCTDGDFNIGVTQGGDLNRLIEQKAKNGFYVNFCGDIGKEHFEQAWDFGHDASWIAQ